MIRIDWNDQIFRSLKEKDNAIIEKIIECNKSGQPLLILTANINKSEHYSALWNKAGIKHTVLNAKNHEREEGISANAGKKHTVIMTTSITDDGVEKKLRGKTLPTSTEKGEIETEGG